MDGERDLGALLGHMDPVLREGAWAILGLDPARAAGLEGQAFAVVREAEGTTLVLPREAVPADLDPGPPWALVTLEVHSSLEAVGFLAVLAGALAREGLCVNALSGFRHDHLLVPWDRREAALAVLEGLRGRGPRAARDAGPGPGSRS